MSSEILQLQVWILGGAFLDAADAGSILPDGGISAEYVLGVFALIIGWFLVDTLKKFRNDINSLSAHVEELKNEQIKLRSDFDNRNTPEYIAGQNARVAEIVYAKIKAITPP